jgi:uncharacterized protein YggT (Ycf19 family)
MQEEQTQVTEVSTQSTVAPTPGEHTQKTYSKKKAIFRVYQVIWYVLGIVEVLLIFRILLKALGANPTSGFANLVYTLSNPLALPFQGIFRTAQVQGSVFEWSTIIAGVVYLIIAFGLVQLFQLVKPTTVQEVNEKINQ